MKLSSTATLARRFAHQAKVGRWFLAFICLIFFPLTTLFVGKVTAEVPLTTQGRESTKSPTVDDSTQRDIDYCADPGQLLSDFGALKVHFITVRDLLRSADKNVDASKVPVEEALSRWEHGAERFEYNVALSFPDALDAQKSAAFEIDIDQSFRNKASPLRFIFVNGPEKAPLEIGKYPFQQLVWFAGRIVRLSRTTRAGILDVGPGRGAGEDTASYLAYFENLSSYNRVYEAMDGVVKKLAAKRLTSHEPKSCITQIFGKYTSHQ